MASHSRLMILVSLAVALAISGGASAQSPAAAPVTSAAPSTEPLAVAPATWSLSSLPGAHGLLENWGLWSDGSITLVNAFESSGRSSSRWRDFVVSQDGGATFQEAVVTDATGKPLPVGLPPFSFTRMADTYYAFGRVDLVDATSTLHGTRVLRSSDGLHWQADARAMRTPSHVQLRTTATSGLIGTGFRWRASRRGVFRGERAADGRSARAATAPVVLTSADGVAWDVAATLPLRTGEQGIGLGVSVAVNGSIVVYGQVATTEDPVRRPAMWRSDDGRTFERVTGGPIDVPTSLEHWGRVIDTSGTYDGGFYAITVTGPRGGKHTLLWTSPDGATWTSHETPSGGGAGHAVGLGSDILVLELAGRRQTTPGVAGHLLAPDGTWSAVSGTPWAGHSVVGVQSGAGAMVVRESQYPADTVTRGVLATDGSPAQPSPEASVGP